MLDGNRASVVVVEEDSRLVDVDGIEYKTFVVDDVVVSADVSISGFCI